MFYLDERPIQITDLSIHRKWLLLIIYYKGGTERVISRYELQESHALFVEGEEKERGRGRVCVCSCGCAATPSDCLGNNQHFCFRFSLLSLLLLLIFQEERRQTLTPAAVHTCRPIFCPPIPLLFQIINYISRKETNYIITKFDLFLYLYF